MAEKINTGEQILGWMNETGEASFRIPGVKDAIAAVMLLWPAQVATAQTHALQSELVQNVAFTELTLDEVLASTDSSLHEKIRSMTPDYISAMSPIMRLALTLPEWEDRDYVIEEVVEFFYNPADQNLKNMIEEFNYAGAPLRPDDLSWVTVFYVTEQRRLWNEIDQTLMAIADRDQMIARMRADNMIIEQEIQNKLLEIDQLRTDRAESEASRAESEANRAKSEAERLRIEAEIVRLRALQNSTNQLIQDIENTPSAA